jgi:hypothetical protein
MFSQPINYYAEEPVLSALNAAYSAIFAELSTETAMNLSNNVTIQDASEHKTEEYKDGEQFVEISDLHDVVQEWFDNCGLNCTMFDAHFADFDAADHPAKVDYDISLVKDSDAAALFNILYARDITVEVDDPYEEESDSHIEYDDFDYSDFIDFAANALEENPVFKDCNIEFDRVGGDINEGDEWTDLYFKIKYPE